MSFPRTQRRSSGRVANQGSAPIRLLTQRLKLRRSYQLSYAAALLLQEFSIMLYFVFQLEPVLCHKHLVSRNRQIRLSSGQVIFLRLESHEFEAWIRELVKESLNFFSRTKIKSKRDIYNCLESTLAHSGQNISVIVVRSIEECKIEAG